MYQTQFTCGRCGGVVSKNTSVCPHCGARLAGIRCKNCGFTGSKEDFKNDHCPKCRSYVNTAGGATCPQCGRKWNKIFCKNCGKLNWLNVIAMFFGGLFGPLLLLAAFSLKMDDGLFLVLIAGLVASAALVTSIVAIIRKIRFRKR